MTREAFEILTHAKIQAVIEANIACDPAEFALRQGDNELPVALIASQLQALQKSRFKLPDWYEARCILPDRAFQQSSSQFAAAMKTYQGNRCLDLTAGLGVDSWHFSKTFNHVTSIEQNPDLATITEHNLQKLGAHNVEVIHSTADTFMRTYSGPPFDLIYVDPDRRDHQDRRLIRLEDCSPNILELLPLLRQHGQTILVKLSPLFDLTEAIRLFPEAQTFSIHSVQNECKEVLVEWAENLPENNPQLITRMFREERFWKYRFPLIARQHPVDTSYAFTEASYLLDPDVACYKAGIQGSLLTHHFPQLRGSFNHREGYFFCQEIPEAFPGRVFKIREMMPYKPGKIKRWKKTHQITQLNITKRNFPLSTAAIRKQLGIQEGGDEFLLCTTIPDGQKYAVWAERLS